MAEEKVEDWAVPPEERKEKLTTDERILEALKELKISYPGEVVGWTGLSRQLVYDRLAVMKHEGRVERVNIHMVPPDDLKERLPELWGLGLKGGMIKRMSWYRLTEGTKEEKNVKKTTKL